MRISDWSSDVCSSDLQRIANRHLGHVLQDLARHGTDVGATVAANLGFIAHTTQSHAYKLSSGCARNGLHQRGLALAAGSEERRVGEECVSTGSSRWQPDHSKNKHRKYNTKHVHTNNMT